MTQREEFEAWWEEFPSAHEDWRFADSDALRWATWQAAKQARPEPSDDYLGKAYRLAKELFDHLAVAPAQPELEPEQLTQLARESGFYQEPDTSLMPSTAAEKWLHCKQADIVRFADAVLQQAQPPAPSDTAITYMTGYSDGRERAAAPIPQQPSVPEGWKLVPIEPTEAMLEVGFFAENDVFDSAKTKRIHVWKDMLSAAPQPKDMK